MRARVHRTTDLVAKLLGRHGVARELREHRLLTRWPELVGERVAARAWPDGLSKGVLWVRVANSSWLNELSFLRDDIIARADEISRWIVAEGSPLALPDGRWDKMAYGIRDTEEFLRAIS